MKKILIMLIYTFVLLSISSCSGYVDFNSSDESNSNKLDIESKSEAKDIVEQVGEAVKNNDAEGLKALFAPSIVQTIDTLDADISSLFDFIDGEFISYEKTRPEQSSGAMFFEGSSRVTEQAGFISMKTDANNYLIYVNYRAEDSGSSDNLGVRSVHIMLENEYADVYYNDTTAGILINYSDSKS